MAFSEIVPSTEEAGTTEYWVAEGISGQCIGEKETKIAVNVNTCCTLNSASASNSIISCNGEKSTVTLSATGGNPPLIYTLQGYTPQSTGTFNNVSAGTYIWSVSENGTGCAPKTGSITITEPAVLSASAVQDSPVVCNGESNGAATVTVSGGNAPYAYSWDKSASASASATDLVAGLHTITITDDKGCVTTASVTIDEPAVLSASADQDSPVVCNGESNGAATVTVSGGNAPYAYSWDKSASASASANDLAAGLHTITITDASASATDLAAGLHTITITDDKGCVTTASVTIDEPAVLSASAVQDSPVVCNGESNGAATVTASGGNAPLLLLWDKSTTPASATDLDAGLHTITITDDKGCVTTASVTIDEPAVLSASADQDSPVVCNGESNGAATVTVLGGNAPYSYSWDKSASTSASATDLLPVYIQSQLLMIKAV
ncbi:MAG: SprB repeat-containing protein [Draconibacterium sp.]|nr:SprB repeat-containing protein [Draconibacterium sp.]